MKIEEIREKLGPDYRVEEKDGAITVELVDIWKGVEFAECNSDSFASYTKGRIYPVSELDGSWVYTKYDDKLRLSNGLHKSKMKPSTEAAYVDQLKAKAHELYGAINDWDRFVKGKWAKEIEERVKVEVEDWVSTTNAKFESFDFSVKMRVESLRPFDPNESSVYLAKCLEEYLNKS